jgi:hypothetical protein
MGAWKKQVQNKNEARTRQEANMQVRSINHLQLLLGALALSWSIAGLGQEKINVKVNPDDLGQCKNEIAEFHRLEIDYWKVQATEACTEKDSAANCEVYRDLIAKSSSKSNLAWLLEGNGTCNGSDYPCFGPEGYNSDYMTGDLLRQWADPKFIEGLEKTGAALWDYSSTVEHCIAKIRLAKWDRVNNVEPSGTNQSADAGSTGCASTPQESFRRFGDELEEFSRSKPNAPPTSSSGSGARDQYQYALFFGTEGLSILEKYRTCLSPADYGANKRALEGTRDNGRVGCERLSTSPDSCTATYPAGWPAN